MVEFRTNLPEGNEMASRSRILFVDDDPDLLETLQEVMSDMAETWDMTFLSRAEFLREIRALAGGQPA
jgi:hypothetical protein